MEYLKFLIDLNDPKTVSAYDELPLWSAMFGLLLLKHVEMRRHIRVLDVGCGTGFPLLELAERLGPTCTLCGIDPWEAALRRAKYKMKMRRVKTVELKVGSASSTPFSDGEFDLVVSNLGINNFENPDAVFAECHRIMKPSATLALTTNLIGHMAEFYEILETTLTTAGDNKSIERLREHINHRATLAKVESMLLRNGFRVSRVVNETGTMRFTDGTALFNHYFIQLGFLDDWKKVPESSELEEVFAHLEKNLNKHAEERGGLNLTIPMAFIEGKRIP